jgi:hypothetical protein
LKYRLNGRYFFYGIGFAGVEAVIDTLQISTAVPPKIGGVSPNMVNVV